MTHWLEPTTPGHTWNQPKRAASASPETGNRPSMPLPIVYEDRPLEPARWEYRCLLIDPAREAIPQETELNALGAEGWVLSGVLDQSRSASRPFVYFYFVRPAGSQ